MKRLRHLLALAATFLGLASIQAATPPADVLHEELRALKTTYETAIASGDLAPLAPLFDAGSSGVTVDNQSFRTFAELQAIYDRFHADFPGVVYRIKLAAEPSLLSGDLAVAHGTAEEFVKTAAGEFTYTSTWTAVLRRTDAGWKLVRSQVTMDPFRNSIVAFLQKKAVLTYVLTALAAGVALGLLLGLALRRRTPAI
ncbi:MAG: DUF4440 domain-containing protein [Verrucomicrobia bacterium]|nr:DUF4440 domain-containing protein [Verrucomicrobiota bacterium]